MATATVLKFMQKTAEDEALRQQLESLLGVGDGNISSEADLDPAESEALKGDRARKPCGDDSERRVQRVVLFDSRPRRDCCGRS